MAERNINYYHLQGTKIIRLSTKIEKLERMIRELDDIRFLLGGNVEAVENINRIIRELEGWSVLTGIDLEIARVEFNDPEGPDFYD